MLTGHHTLREIAKEDGLRTHYFQKSNITSDVNNCVQRHAVGRLLRRRVHHYVIAAAAAGLVSVTQQYQPAFNHDARCIDR